MAAQMRVGDIGTEIRVLVLEDGLPFDAHAALTKTLTFFKPSGAVIERVPNFETDGTDGVFVYATVAGDLDEAGPWNGQIGTTFSNGQWKAEPFAFDVGANL